jgi:arylsulfatase A-like enzyme
MRIAIKCGRKAWVGSLVLPLLAALASPAGADGQEAEIAKRSPAPRRPAVRSTSPPPKGPSEPLPPRNVLLITLDTTRADHLSCYGYPLLTSPHIDELAARGLRLSRTSAVVPLTGPGHASILTGLYPRDHGAIRNGVPMAEGVPTLATILSSYGYRTAAFVSGWTVRGEITRLDRGFHVYDDDMTDRYHVVNNQRPGDQTADAAIGWLEANEADPFFLWVHLFDPHAPYRNHGLMLAPNPGGSGSRPSGKKIAHYDQEIAFADAQIGRLLEALERVGRAEATLIVLTSDHGEAFGEHGEHGHGRKLYETTQHVPMILLHPDLGRGRVSNLPASTLDVSPTILSLLGLAPLRHGDGVALNEALQEPAAFSRREIYQETFAGARKGIWRLFSPRLSGKPLQVAIRQGDWKAILTPKSNELKLFDLARDPGESRDLAGEQTVRADRLRPSLVAHAAREWRPPANETVLTEEDRRRLEALGYVD